MANTHITMEMLEAGYKEIQTLAAQQGQGWALNMVSKEDVERAMILIYKAMVSAAPPEEKK